MPDEDQPPEDIWLNAKLLNEHFDNLARSRRTESDSGDVEVVPMVQNELTASLRG